MAIAHTSEAARLRSRLKHPIVDADAHMIELDAVINDYIREVGGSKMPDKFMKYMGRLVDSDPERALGEPGDHWWDFFVGSHWHSMTQKERRDSGTMTSFWWFLPTANTDYRGMASVPKLFYERMDEFGLDFSVVFPSVGIAMIAIPGIQDEELRRVATRAYNMYAADLYGEFADRMTPAATIPAHTPEEAIAELDYAIGERGLKVAMLPGYVVRPVKREPGNARVPEGRLAPFKMDMLGIDSDYDYDPMWQKCLDLGVSPCFHSTANGIPWEPRNSASNLMYTTIGNFGESADATSKALFMGGVTRRFPDLRFAFLEGGIGRALVLYNNMIGFWKKRNPEALMKYTDPAKLNLARMAEIIDQYGHPRIQANKDEILAMLEMGMQEPRPEAPGLDDWHGARIKRPEQFRELFETSFYFGCEADDPTVGWAFNTKLNPFGAKLRPILGSDISHVDVIDPAQVVPEAFELLDDGILNEDEFEEFVFTNAVRLYGGTNPDFFKGTPVEAQAAQVLAQEKGGR